MASEIRVILCGLGPIGQGIARLALNTPGLRVVGATDVSPTVAGKDIGRRGRFAPLREFFCASSGRTD